MNAREIWKPIPGFEGFYETSDAGRIRSLSSSRGLVAIARPTPRIVAIHPSRANYLQVRLCRRGVHRIYSVHRLILMAFTGPPPTDRHQAAHNNGIRTDNRPENLRWATAKENMGDRDTHGTTARGDRHGMKRNGFKVRGELGGRALFSESVVIQIRRDAPTLGVASQARRYNVSEGAIRNIVKRRTWKHIPIEDGRIEP